MQRYGLIISVRNNYDFLISYAFAFVVVCALLTDAWHTCVLYVYTCIGTFLYVYIYFLAMDTHTPLSHTCTYTVLTGEASVCGNADVDSGENDAQLCQPSSHEGFFRSEEPKGVCVCVNPFHAMAIFYKYTENCV